ncbi:helix-turn-helix domain-containing protein [Pseudomonas sp. PAMC 25886]|uniref:helix-turn-helix domain-containing protein n=1 Tax=Pseudomonas sp. PAMC 25886 TaxID=1125977 RepID=UPI001930B15B|nr:helix-turn-helix domain-containing protein [Pseudomonas sp. PAMC 25886]
MAPASVQEQVSSQRGVAEVGLAVGYDSPSQFSREYRRFFGRPPREDGEVYRSAAIGVSGAAT